jgi:hypothetical protein
MHDGLGGPLVDEKVVPRRGHGGASAVRWGGWRSNSSDKGGPVGVGA